LPTKIGPNQIVVDRDMSPAEWRAKRNLSRWKYYKLKREGRQPALVNGNVTQAEDRKWERRELRRGKSEAARRERERKSEMARIAGRKAAKSLRHYCNRKKQPD
jgi:hypothetical protein